MPAWSFRAVDEVLVYAVINEVPLISAWYLEHAIMCRSVYLVGLVLDEDYRLFCYLDRTERIFACSVCYMVVGRAGIVNAPMEVIDAVALEHVWCLAVSIIF